MFQSVEKQQLKVPAHIDYLGDLRDFVTQIGRKHGYTDKYINAFKLAVDEAATNIIRHAYRDQEGLITIRAIVRKNSLTISLIDQGTYFDPKRVKDPDLNRYIDIGKKGGLGIFIMRKLMDEIDYRKTEEGNELRITKYREAPQKKKIFKSAPSIPFSIKTKYFFRTIAIITFIIAVSYLYFFLKTDDKETDDFLSNARSRNSQIINRINAAPPEAFTFIEDVVHPIYEEYENEIYRMSIEDSTGIIVYSSNLGDLLSKFARPEGVEEVEQGVFKYTLNGNTVYEFESPIVIKNTGTVYGKAHIILSAKSLRTRITSIRMDYLKLALSILGLSCIGVVLLIYLVLNPFRKLSEWVKNLGHGDIEDEIDIDSSSEIGEIAQAFSGITQKLRESQKNLADQERLQKEMQVAQEIQQTLLPMEFPQLEGYQISAYYEAAKEVGGDYYDFVEVDTDTLGIAVADVSGKGVPGSLVMTMIRTALRTEARGIKDAAEVLARVNTFVSNDIKKGMFVTVFYLIIDSKKRRLNYASAGHNPMILYRASTQQTYYLNPKGFPIGVQLPEKDYFKNYIQSDTIQLTKDDILLLYTDGITEAMNSQRELFGEERLQKVLAGHGHLSAADFAEKLKDSIYSFTEGAPQYDDITLVAIKEESTREEDELRRAKEAHQLISEGKSIRDACETVNLTTYAYYNKYKKAFEEEGADAFEIEEEVSVEAKHLSIQEKTKIFDIIANHPEYGASRIREELNTERYGFTEITESRIYDELVRNRLNTKQLREAYIQRAKKNKRRLKPPGTPFMTLDGNIIIKKHDEISDVEEREQRVPPRFIKEKGKDQEQKPEDGKTPDVEKPYDVEGTPGDDEKLMEDSSDLVIGEEEADIFIDTPLEEILAKKEAEEKPDEEKPSLHEESEWDEAANLEANAKNEEIDTSEVTLEEMISESERTAEVDFDDDEDETIEQESQTTAGKMDFDEEEDGEESEVKTEELELDEEVSSEEKPQMDEIEEDSPILDDYSFEEFFDSGSGMQDEADFEEFEEEKVESQPGQDELIETPPENEDEDGIAFQGKEEESESRFESEQEETKPAELSENVDELENEQAQSDDATDEDLTVSSIDELLADEVYKNKEENFETYEEIEEVKEELERSDVKEPGFDEETVSFSDLIQALDDEIVYITDLANKNNRKEKKSPQNSEKLEGANQNSKNKELILINGIRYYKNNQYDKAIAEFKKVIDKYPDFKEAHSILGNAYFRNKLYDEAASSYKIVKEIDPNDVTAYENMGVIFANQGQYEDAIKEWKKVLELNPERTDIEDKIKKALSMID